MMTSGSSLDSVISNFERLHGAINITKRLIPLVILPDP